MSQVRIPVSARWISGLFCLLLVSLSPLRAVEQFKPLASLPRDSSPTSTLFQGQDGCLYGVLEYTGINHEDDTNGLVYQLSTEGGLTVLHRFPWNRVAGTPDATGSEPTHNLAMGKDGFLYGITKFGGAYGCGVLYRLSASREYSVLANLTPQLSGEEMGRIVVGPDQAVYTQTSDVGLIRIGFDGSVQVVAAEYAGGVNIASYNADGSELVVTWSTGRLILNWIPGFPRPISVTVVKPVLHMRILELPSLNVKESQIIDFFPEREYDAKIIAVRENEILALSPPPVREPAGPGRLVSFDRAGNATQIAEIGGTSTGGPFVPSMKQPLVTADGTIFFTTGDQTKGEVYLSGGTEIHWLKRNGESKKIADLDGYALAAWCEGLKGNNLYGVSFGPVVLESEDSGSASEVSAPGSLRTPLSASAAALTRSSRVRRATFRYQADPTTGNFLPIAKPDQYVLPGKRKVTAMDLPVLRNDRDVETGALDIIEVGSGQNGTATILPGVSGKAPVLSYTPNDGLPLSDTFTYTIRDAHGGTAVGQVFIRGVLNGRFRGSALGQSAEGVSPAVSLDGIDVKVASSGQLSGAVRLNGRSVGLTGKLSSDNAVRLHRRIRGTSDVVFADLALVNVNNARHLRYKITYLSQVFEGTLASF